MGTASLRPLTILPQICTVRCTKLRKHFCGECMIALSLSRSGALQSFDCALVCSPRGCCVVLAVSYCNTAKCCCLPVLGSIRKLRCLCLLQSFFALLFTVSFRAGRSMIERCLLLIKDWFSVTSV